MYSDQMDPRAALLDSYDAELIAQSEALIARCAAAIRAARPDDPRVRDWQGVIARRKAAIVQIRGRARRRKEYRAWR